MKKQWLAGMLSAVMMAATVCVWGIEENIPKITEADYQVNVSLPSEELYPEDEVYLVCRADNPLPLYGVEAEILYDEDFLELKRIEHPFSEETNPVCILREEEGRAIYGCTRVGQAKDDGNGGDLLTLIFTAKKSGETHVIIEAMKLVMEDMGCQAFDLSTDPVSIKILERTPLPTPTRRPVSSMGGGVVLGGGTSAAVPRPTMTPAPSEEEEADALSFHDLGEVPWAEESVLALAKHGVIQGTGEGRFSPMKQVTRGELAKMLAEGFSFAEPKARAGRFSDVKENAWYYPYVMKGAEHGIICGMEDGRFCPEVSVTRQDYAVMLARTARAAGISLPSGREKVAFMDEAEVADYALADLELLCRAEVLRGDADGTFRPSDSLSRAEAAVGVYRLYLLATEGEGAAL